MNEDTCTHEITHMGRCAGCGEAIDYSILQTDLNGYSHKVSSFVKSESIVTCNHVPDPYFTNTECFENDGAVHIDGVCFWERCIHCYQLYHDILPMSDVNKKAFIAVLTAALC